MTPRPHALNSRQMSMRRSLPHDLSYLTPKGSHLQTLTSACERPQLSCSGFDIPRARTCARPSSPGAQFLTSSARPNLGALDRSVASNWLDSASLVSGLSSVSYSSDAMPVLSSRALASAPLSRRLAYLRVLPGLGFRFLGYVYKVI